MVAIGHNLGHQFFKDHHLDHHNEEQVLHHLVIKVVSRTGLYSGHPCCQQVSIMGLSHEQDARLEGHQCHHKDPQCSHMSPQQVVTNCHQGCQCVITIVFSAVNMSPPRVNRLINVLSQVTPNVITRS